MVFYIELYIYYLYIPVYPMVGQLGNASCSSPHPSPQCLLHFLFPGRIMHLPLNPPFLFSVGQSRIESWQSFNLQVIFNLWVHTMFVFLGLVTLFRMISLVPPIGLQFHDIIVFFSFFFFKHLFYCFFPPFFHIPSRSPAQSWDYGHMLLHGSLASIMLAITQKWDY